MVGDPASGRRSSSGRRGRRWLLWPLALAAFIPLVPALPTIPRLWEASAQPPAAKPAARIAPRKAEPARPPAPEALQEKLAKLAAGYKEPVGIAVSDVRAGWIAGVNAQDLFPQQSVSKAWTALQVLDEVDRGRLHLGDPVLMAPQDRSVFYQPIARHIGKQGFETSVGDLLYEAITQSDNAANDKLMQLAGGSGAVTAGLAAKGLDGIRIGGPEHDLQAKICGMTWRPELGVGGRFKAERALLPEALRDSAIRAYLADPADGATPMGVVKALSALQRGELLSPASSALFLDILRQVKTGRHRLIAGLPQGWSIGHKTGTGQDWSGGSMGINDVGLLTAPDGRTYAVAVFIRNTRQPLSARSALMQKVARSIVEQWRSDGGSAKLAAAAPDNARGKG